MMNTVTYPTASESTIGTVRALRLALVQIDNQQMTVGELRRKLFDQLDQDSELTISELAIIADEKDE
jgi:hypothetical protein